MPHRFSIFLWVVVLITSIHACTPDAEGSRKSREEAFKHLDQSFENLKTEPNAVVDFRVLKDALPDQVAGMKRVTHEGQKTGLAGFSVSTAEATYEDGEKHLTITLLDTGGLGSILSGIASWSQLEVDKEDENGYERTTLIDGRKVYEKYMKTTKEGTVAMIAADRFVVTISGQQVEESDLLKALSKIKFES